MKTISIPKIHSRAFTAETQRTQSPISAISAPLRCILFILFICPPLFAASSTTFPPIGTNLTFTPGATRTRTDSNAVITPGGASNILEALTDIGASFGGTGVTNISTDTPLYLAVTGTNGGTNCVLSITEIHLTNIGSWLTGQNLFDPSGVAATQMNNFSNTVNLRGYLTAASNINATTLNGQLASYYAPMTVVITNIVVVGSGSAALTNNTAYVSVSGSGGLTLFDVYEATLGSMSSFRPTNSTPPSISGAVTNGSTVTLSFGTFNSIKPSSFVTNQCGVWVDDGTNGFWGQRSTGASYTITGLNTGFVLYTVAAVSNQFGWGSAVSAGITITNAAGAGATCAVWVRDDLSFSGGQNYQVNDVLAASDGTPVSTPLQIIVTGVDENGAVLTLTGNAPYYYANSIPTSPNSMTGGSGFGFSVQVSHD